MLQRPKCVKRLGHWMAQTQHRVTVVDLHVPLPQLGRPGQAFAQWPGVSVAQYDTIDRQDFCHRRFENTLQQNALHASIDVTIPQVSLSTISALRNVAPLPAARCRCTACCKGVGVGSACCERM